MPHDSSLGLVRTVYVHRVYATYMTVYLHRICAPCIRNVYDRICAPYMCTVYVHRICAPCIRNVYDRIRAPYIGTVYVHRVYATYMTVYLVISLPKTLHIHRIYIYIYIYLWFWPALLITYHATLSVSVSILLNWCGLLTFRKKNIDLHSEHCQRSPLY